MNTFERTILTGCALAACVVSAGCASTAMHEPVAGKAAVAMEQRHCSSDMDDQSIAEVLSGAAVEHWEPAYVSAPGAGAYYKRLAGAAFTVRPVNRYSAEWLARALECHSARRMLGRVAAAPQQEHDPFWLPGKTVDIGVESTGKDFLVSVRSLDVADAGEIMARAKAFAEWSARR
jgi:hypothetical protein